MSGDILLDRANVVPVLAAVNAAAGSGINFRTTGNLSLDSVSADGALFAAVSGVTTTGAGGTVRLQEAGLSQTTAGIVNADALGIRNSAGDVILDQPNTVNTFAANNATAAGRVTLQDNTALVIGDVTAQDTFPAISGVTTNAGTAFIQAAGNVTQTATGLVNASALGVNISAGGTIRLDQANAVNTFAANETPAGGLVNFRTTTGLTLDTVASGSGLLPAIAGVTTNAGTTLLHAANGINQTASGLVTTNTLGVRNDATGNVILDQPNVVNIFAANNAAAAGRVTLRDANAIVLGDVPADGTFPATSGITSNAGTAFVQAAGNVTQTATGLVNSSALAVGSTAGGTIRLDQANTVNTFAANETPANGLINFRTNSGLTLDTVASGSALLPSISGVTTNAGTALLHAANGIGQTNNGTVTTATLAVRNDTSGDISLLQTFYTAAPPTGNTVANFAGVNGAAGGRLDLATLGALTIGTVAADGTFAQVRGITTNNGGSNLRTGTDFTIIDPVIAIPGHGPLVPLISLGSGNFLLNPGQTGNSVVTFNAEAQTTGTFRLGLPHDPQGTGDNTAPGVVPPNPNPAGTLPVTVPPVMNNANQDAFNVRPSSHVQILVNGNLPTVLPGDSLKLITTDPQSVPPGTTVAFTTGGVGAGRFDFSGAGAPKAVLFTGIEKIGGLSIAAAATQTGPATYSISAFGTVNGLPITGGLTGGQAPSNPFVVSPNLINPFAPFGAPRLAVGDFDGDGLPDLIIANGPNNSPLVTVVKGSVFTSNGSAHGAGHE